MSQTVRIYWKHILSRVRVSVRPGFFIPEKYSKPRVNRTASASVYFNGQRPAIVTSLAGRHGWVPQTHRIAITSTTVTALCGICWCVHAFVRVRAHACACVRAWVRACVRACVRDVFEIYDNNIWPRLIMIIIKIIILYFKQIKHTLIISPQRVLG